MPPLNRQQQVMGGAPGPVASQAFRGATQGLQQRALGAMRERGATGRGRMASNAQVQSAQIGARARTVSAQIQARSQAMQVAAADRRAAENITARRKDREFDVSLQRTEESMRKRLMLAEDEIAKAREARDEVRTDKANGVAADLLLNQLTLDAQITAAKTGTTLRTFADAKKSNEQKAKMDEEVFNMSKRWEEERGRLGVLRKDTRTSLVSNQDFDASGFIYKFNKEHAGGAFRGKERKLLPILSASFREDADIEMEGILTKEINKLGIQGVTGTMLKSGEYTTLEEMVEKGKGEGGLGKGELQSLLVLIDETKMFLQDKITSGEEGQSSTLLYREYLGRATEAGRALGKLRDSSKKNVSTTYKSAYNSLYGISPSAATYRASQQLGGSTDIGEIADIIIGAYQQDARDPNDPEYRGIYGEFFERAESSIVRSAEEAKKKYPNKEVIEPNVPAFTGEI